MKLEMRAKLLTLVVAASVAGACSDPTLAPVDAPPEGSTAVTEAAAPHLEAATREGGALGRAPDSSALYLADEDRSLLRRIPLPVDVNGLGAEVALPGKPAQVLALDDKVLVTVRDPGKLLVMTDQPVPTVIRDVSVPSDAWGIAVSPDEKVAYVTSAWTHKVTAVHIEDGRVLWTVDVAREPRGITVTGDGKSAYVSHLVGSEITKIEGVEGGTPRVARVTLPPDPGRTYLRYDLTASLGYALTLAPDGQRLYAARRALGTAGWNNWQGTGAIDVLVTKDDSPLFPPRTTPAYGTLTEEGLRENGDAAGAHLSIGSDGVRVPRAMIYRKKTNTLLVASEDEDRVAEHDAMAVAPQNVMLTSYRPGSISEEDKTAPRVTKQCGAPTGLALSSDEDLLWIWCRTTSEIAIVRLDAEPGEKTVKHEAMPIVALEKSSAESGGEKFAQGRRLFFNGTDAVVSGGLSCAGCHPDGRDDGFTWFELERPASRFAGTSSQSRTFLAGTLALRFVFYFDESAMKEAKMYARQTPILAGRVAAPGPYGWHAESPDLTKRIREGFQLHRWDPGMVADPKILNARAESIAVFIREGLTPPPVEKRELDEREKLGEALFKSPRTECSTCHEPTKGFTDRSKIALAQGKPRVGFNEDPDLGFKTPSLLFVGGSAPYFHDGSAATLEDVIEKNYDRMGKTTGLKDEERAALVAYLKTL